MKKTVGPYEGSMTTLSFSRVWVESLGVGYRGLGKS
jgi:hypothetical protein